MEKNIIGLLLYKHLQGTLTGAEKQQLEEWRLSSDDNRLLLDELKNEDLLAEKLAEFHPDNRLIVRDRILRRIRRPATEQPALIRPIHRMHFLRRWGWAAASIALLLSVGAYLEHRSSEKDAVAGIGSPKQNNHNRDTGMGREGAILTLADGRTVALDSKGNGLVALQKGSRVTLKDGRLSYDATGETAGEMKWNSMSTPKGRQFRLTLPDGTGVWLNAASSIRYPTVFSGPERKVSITGEAYFEVAANDRQPFRVTINDETEVQVLGTHFNINSYKDEPAIRTTLLEGSIKIVKNQSSMLLKAGQQAIVGQQIAVEDGVNVQRAVSWKNGLFNFEGATVDELMRQLARWYDLEIVYAHDIPKRTFHGDLGRDLRLSQVMEVLALFDLTCELKGNTLTIE